MSEGQWSSSQVKAWQWVQSGLERGMTATATVKEYRAGGGHISNEYWYALYREGFSLYGKRERIQQVPMSYVVPETMSTESWFDYEEQYVMMVKLYGTNPLSGERFSSFVTVESNQLLTRREWLNLAGDAINNTPGSLPMVVDYSTSWSFFKRKQ